MGPSLGFYLQSAAIALFFSNTVIAELKTHGSCGNSSILVQDAIHEAKGIASNALRHLQHADPNVNPVLRVLFGEEAIPAQSDARDMIQSSLDAVVSLDWDSVKVTFFCGDDFFKPRGDRWYDSYSEALTPPDFEPQCTESGGPLLYAQSWVEAGTRNGYFILCPDVWAFVTTYRAGVTIGIQRDGLITGQALTFYQGLSGSILHELLHFANLDPEGDCDAVVDESFFNGQPGSSEGREEMAFGFEQCQQLALREPEKSPTNADSITLLAIALFFTESDFSTGIAIPKRY
ncbi:MAG: hypothetical protein M1837_007314 [Sclerophora amabilis]|nr:MAG: hypothetical protein M1837_007314 [Sclerophora amabilis]